MVKFGEQAALAEKAIVSGRSDLARLDDLDSRELFELAVGAVGEIDHAHASAAEDAVGLEDAEGGEIGRRRRGLREGVVGLEEIGGEGEHFGVAVASGLEEGIAGGAGGELGSIMENLLEALEPVRGHR